MNYPLGAVALLSLLAFGTRALAQAPETVVIAAPWHVMSLDPSVSGDAYQRLEVAETLVDADLNGTLRPGLATGWSQSEDGLTWRFELREGVAFHDGTPFDAETAVAALTRAAARPGLLDKSPVTAIRAEDGAVVISTSSPFAALPAVLAHASTIIFAPASFDAEGKPLEAIGTGPYRVTAVIPPQTMELERFDDYWGEEPFFPRARFLSASRGETRALLAESGDAHLVYTLNPASYSRLTTLDHVETGDVPVPRVTVVKVNAQHPFLSDPQARQALSLAIDRAGIAAGILRFPGSEASQLFPSVMEGWHNPDLPDRDRDPEAARQMLTDLGWQPGADGILERGGERFALTLRTYPDRAELPIIAAALQQQWREIGVEIEIAVANHSEIPAGHQDGSLDLALYARNYGLSPDPIGTMMTDFMNGGGDWGAMGWHRPEVDEIIATVAEQSDPEIRAPMLERLSELLHEDLPLIPITWYRQTAAHAPQLQNVIIDPYERSYGIGELTWAE